MSRPEYLDDLDPDDPRTSSQQIAHKLRAAILTGKLAPGDKLPSQKDLATRYGVARETIKAALRLLDRERLVVSRQGSGAYVRAQTERPVGLRPHIEAAFERPHVAIDFAGYTGETLRDSVAEALDKVRAGRLVPESVAVRVMVTDTRAPMVLPRPTDDVRDEETDTAVRERADRISRRSIDSLRDSVNEIADLGLIRSATVEARVHQLPPMFKLYILNNEEAFFAFYPVVEHAVKIGDDELPTYDVLGRDASLFHFAASEGDGDGTSLGPLYVDQARGWFESVWTTIAREYRP